MRWNFLSTRLNDRFTDLADRISTLVGMWFWSALSLVLLLVWVVWGILFVHDWFTSQAWNFPLNTVTTVGEWFMEGLIAAAANRIERRNREQAARLERMERDHGDQLALILEFLQCSQAPSSFTPRKDASTNELSPTSPTAPSSMSPL